MSENATLGELGEEQLLDAQLDHIPEDGGPFGAAAGGVLSAGLLALEDAGLDRHLLLPLHDEYVLALPTSEAAALVRDIARLVAARLGDVERPLDANVGGRTWSSLSGEGA